MTLKSRFFIRQCMGVMGLVLFLASGSGAQNGVGEVEQAIVKVYMVSAEPNYYVPWVPGPPARSTGSGSIIENNRILTNAHVVSNQTFLEVRREGDPKRFQARVVAVSHDADLALLTVDDPAFFQGIHPLSFGDLPHVQDQTVVYGYPMGGDALSITEGVVSRVENNRYVHSFLSLLSGQLDAAINPGNSGGPVMIDGRIVGVVMQSIENSQNIGYMVPSPVIRHFLEDLKDGTYDGFPSSGINFEAIQNAAISRRYGIEQEQSGVLVTRLAHGSPASKVLRLHDVILEIDGHRVAGDGTIEFRPGSRTAFSYLFQQRQIGETIPLTIIRDGESLAVEFALSQTSYDQILVPYPRYDKLPRYFTWGGLVFTPLSWNFLEQWGSEWTTRAPSYFTSTLFFDNALKENRDEIVVLAHILSAPVNAGYDDRNMEIVEEIDGTPVRGLDHLIKLLEQGSGEFVEIKTNLDQLIIMNRREALASSAEILARYGIQADRQIE